MAAIFRRALLTHIAKYRHYPDQARRDRLQGTVQLGSPCGGMGCSRTLGSTPGSGTMTLTWPPSTRSAKSAATAESSLRVAHNSEIPCRSPSTCHSRRDSGAECCSFGAVVSPASRSCHSLTIVKSCGFVIPGTRKDGASGGYGQNFWRSVIPFRAGAAGFHITFGTALNRSGWRGPPPISNVWRSLSLRPP
jgi:hypothetical protein